MIRIRIVYWDDFKMIVYNGVWPYTINKMNVFRVFVKCTVVHIFDVYNRIFRFLIFKTSNKYIKKPRAKQDLYLISLF